MDTKYNIRESLEIVDQSQTTRYVSRFEPLLYVPAFTQKDFHYNVHTGLPTQGTSIEDLDNTNLEYTTPLSNNNNIYTRDKAQQQSPLTRGIGTKPNNHNHLFTKRDRHKAKQSQTPLH